MHLKMWRHSVLLFVGLVALALPASGFWWPKATTETPRSQVLQQIPLTYFRTYTYQPLTGGGFGVPLFGFGAAQTPLLSGGRHFDPFGQVTSYAAARRHDANGASYKADITPPALASVSSAVPSTTPAPAPAPTTTTTTTTTTPAPTTTTTTSTTTTSSTTSAPPPSSSTESGSGLRYASYNAEYPTYSRRVNNLYNARPQYPYPDYFNYQSPQSGLAEKAGNRIQFVPCMCPVSMPSVSSMSGMSGMSGLGLNGATSSERDRPAGVSISTVPLAAPLGTSEVGSAEHNAAALQARHIDSESEFGEDTDEEQEADSSADVDEEDVAVGIGQATNVAHEPQQTTPAVESNSVV